MNFQDGKISIKKFSSEEAISFKYSNLYQVSSPQLKKLSELLCLDRKGGKTFRDNLLSAGMLLGRGLKDITSKVNEKFIAVIGIPRGGISLAEGICKSIPKSNLFYTNDGRNSDSKKPLLLQSNFFQKCQLIIVADTVVDLGTTAERTLRFLAQNYTESIIVLVSLITSVDGAYRLEKTFSNLEHYTSIIEKNIIWVEIAKNINRRMLPIIGDIGDLVSK